VSPKAIYFLLAFARLSTTTLLLLMFFSVVIGVEDVALSFDISGEILPKVSIKELLLCNV